MALIKMSIRTCCLDTIQDFFSNFRIKWQLNWLKNSTFPLKIFFGRLTYVWQVAIEKSWFLTFKVNFVCQKLSESFNFFFIEEYQFRGIFVVIDIFCKLQILNPFVSKIMPIFQSPPAKHTLICQKKKIMKKCYFPLN